MMPQLNFWEREVRQIYTADLPPCRVLLKKFRSQLPLIFEDKRTLRKACLKLLPARFEWEPHLWPALERWAPDPETPDEEINRKKEGGHQGGRLVSPSPTPNRLGCIHSKFAARQIAKIVGIITCAGSPTELILRAEQEIEIL